MVGILSFLQDIALEVVTIHACKGTKYAAFLTELNNKLCSLNDVYVIYLILVYIYWYIVLVPIYCVCFLYANCLKV